MKIGYPCINRTLPVSSTKTFRLASYSEERLKETVESNLDGLLKILQFNVENNLLFFRISSDLIPFGSHPVNTFPWKEYFHDTFIEIGTFIKENNMRISMHPDQFVLLHSPKENVVESSIAELEYHAAVLDALELEKTHKIQIHLGGAYGDKEDSIQKFVERYKRLPSSVQRRLVVENDDRIYSVKDCLKLNEETGIPILFDNFHHSLNNNGESIREAGQLCFNTWLSKDGIPMTDYSSQDTEPGKRIGKHCEHIDTLDFKKYLEEMKGLDFDVMLEIKDKEVSALEAMQVIPG